MSIADRRDHGRPLAQGIAVIFTLNQDRLGRLL
jgi:hypothetical protein